MGLAGCGGPSVHVDAREQAAPIAIVLAERGLTGARLVGVDAEGDRQYPMIAAGAPGGALVRETNPALSPDGAWLAFSSSRDRTDSGSSVWLAPVGEEATPVRIDAVDAVETNPAWMPDGRAIVFASTAEGGDFDLWRVTLADHRAEQLTHDPGQEFTPAIAPDGTIAYSALDDTGASHLELRAPDGTVSAITDGPADVSPAFTPDGAMIAFSRPVERATGAADAELWLLDRANGIVDRVSDIPLTDESGPVFSRDGRYLFATSVLRGEGGHVIFSSVICVDLHETPRRARIIRDRVKPMLRLTPAVLASSLAERSMHRAPEYLPELERIMAEVIAKQQHEDAP